MRAKRIIISRTDGVGDVVLTLPVAGVLKRLDPGCEIIFLGTEYTKTVAETSEHVDEFVDWERIRRSSAEEQVGSFERCRADAIIHAFPVKEIARLARRARIPLRIGSTGRVYHYYSCNRLVPLSRRRSSLHEAQLNLKLIRPLGGKKDYSLGEIAECYGFTRIDPLDEEIGRLVSATGFNLILHTKTRGSAREWGLENYSRLMRMLPPERYRIFITGTEAEGRMIRASIPAGLPHVVDVTGKLSMKQLISFIDAADGLVSASTGPLHIAAALGKHAIGLYPPIKPMHPGRWAPVGKKAGFIVTDKPCSKCRGKNVCECMLAIEPETVQERLNSIRNDRTTSSE